MTSINVNIIDTIERGDHLRLEKLIKLGADIFSIQSFPTLSRHSLLNPCYDRVWHGFIKPDS